MAHRAESRSVELYARAGLFVIKQVQLEIYVEEIDQIQQGRPVAKNSRNRKLNSIVDKDGMLRVGGRINKADLSPREKNPVIIPGRHHIATLLIRHYRSEVKHQRRHFTEGVL